MRYTSALVLSTLAIGPAAALNNKHASFHSRREQSREAPRGVDYSKVDYSDVNWHDALKGVDWTSVFDGKKAAPTSAPAQAAAPSAAAAGYKAEVTSAAAAYTTPAPSSAAASVASSVASSASSSKSSSKADAGNALNVATNFFVGVESWLSKLGVTPPANGGATTNSAEMYIGNGGTWKATFTNNKDDDVLLVCWNKPGMWINTHTPLITLKLGKGQSQTVSFNEGVSGGCGPMYSSTTMQYGMLWNTILEFTFQTGAGGFDVSREINMKGDYISAKGSNSGCFSDNDNCVFKCKNGKDSCTDAQDYDLFNKGYGCNGGLDAKSGGTGGSCELQGVKSEHLEVTFS